jgi:hypothetical protein
MQKFYGLFGAFVLTAAIIVAIGLLVAIPVYFLWNWCLVGAVDGVHEITWLQAWGLNVLCNCLFKSSISVKKD